MLTAEISILYVANVMKSADFYSSLLNLEPVEKSPTFALFILKNGFKLGLWSSHTVEPGVPPTAAQPQAQGEIVFSVPDLASVDALYREWGFNRQITVIQKPVRLDFGYTFSVQDVDGHRLRVCFLEDEA
ncbi:drug:proton antiporter [Serratia marcescens]|uniref:Drug:proton antiporter n=1 Tax=Serratia marcescens TaxID=615 RepID=A0A1Q4NZ96_SERMA|nr:VOC family protein [Serratia marcescens]OKB66192.1 drug:proton antiporter [Serratia marcescens]